jgi:type 1 glutamine amidotransferase
MGFLMMRTFTLALAALLACASAAAARPKIRALIVDGQNNHNWREGSPVMKRALEATGLFTVDVATAPPEKSDLGGFKPDFAAYQVIVDNYNGDEWPTATRQAFLDYVKGGGGLVVVHAADNAFGNWEEFNKVIGLGGWGDRTETSGAYLFWRDGKVVRAQMPGFSGHHGRQHPYQVTAREPAHPILRGLPPVWMHTRDELYDSLRGPGENLEVLATAYSDPATGGTGRDEPALFTIGYGRGRVFHTILGDNATTMECVGFVTTLTRGAEWAATGAVTQKVPADFPTATRTRSRVGLNQAPVPEVPAGLDKSNVVWSAPSEDAHGSMPLGNGDVSVNAWMEKTGDLVFYVGKSDAWSDSARLLKIGRVRVRFTPNPFLNGFRQELKLRDGAVEISGSGGRLRLWVDANQPVVRLQAESAVKFTARATAEIWRTGERTLSEAESDSAREPGTIVELADHVVEDNAQRTLWYHRNEKSIWASTVQGQGVTGFAGKDPLLGRTFGAMLEKSPSAGTKHVISVHVLGGQPASAEEWLRELRREAAFANANGVEAAWTAHRRWWSTFWTKSWIRVGGTAEAETVTRGYTLERYMNACAGRGGAPIKFNGSTFVVDSRATAKKPAFDADYRQWGGPYWFQNTRLLYWPMTASSDFDLMLPLFNMYRDALPLAEARTRAYYNHAGAFFPETMYFWSSYAGADYTYKGDRSAKPAGYVMNPYIRYYWQGGIELVAMMLDYFDYTEDRAFLRDTLLPVATSVMEFYDQHYARANGKLAIEPAQSLETWWVARDPLPEVAGLGFVLDRLVAAKDEFIPAARREQWRRLRGELPEIPMRDGAAGRVLSPAAWFEPKRSNIENPELYAIFPYRVFGVEKPELEMARRSFAARERKGAYCWHQDDIQAAYLGLAEEAARMVAARFASSDAGSRFPAFWGPNHDYIPDMDHGGAGQSALQAMLVQAEGKKIVLLPAWPKQWDAEFKLRAPGNTTVEGVVRAGKLESLKVQPAARAKDVVQMEAQ